MKKKYLNFLESYSPSDFLCLFIGTLILCACYFSWDKDNLLILGSTLIGWGVYRLFISLICLMK